MNRDVTSWLPARISLLLPLFMMVFLPTMTRAAVSGDGANPSPVARGGNLVAGSFSFSSAGDGYYENPAGDRTQEWSVRPGGGYFVIDGLALNFHLEGSWFTQGETRVTTYQMGPVMEYYWDTTGGEDPRGKILPYAGLGYLWGQSRDESPAFNTKYNSGLTTMSVGLAWMVSSQVATDISINYRTGRFTQKIPEDGLGRQANRLTVMIGFKAFIP